MVVSQGVSGDALLSFGFIKAKRDGGYIDGFFDGGEVERETW